jgi:hypothetical protein
MADGPKRRPPKSVRKAEALALFSQQYARKAQKRREPNDRRYDRRVEQRAKQMSPEQLDALLRQGDED